MTSTGCQYFMPSSYKILVNLFESPETVFLQKLYTIWKLKFLKWSCKVTLSHFSPRLFLVGQHEKNRTMAVLTLMLPDRDSNPDYLDQNQVSYH